MSIDLTAIEIFVECSCPCEKCLIACSGATYLIYLPCCPDCSEVCLPALFCPPMEREIRRLLSHYPTDCSAHTL